MRNTYCGWSDIQAAVYPTSMISSILSTALLAEKHVLIGKHSIQIKQNPRAYKQNVLLLVPRMHARLQRPGRCCFGFYFILQ